MRQHFWQISNMITDLKTTSHTLTDEQHVQAIIHSLHDNWEHMKVNLTYNNIIKTFDDTACHLELEEDRIEVAGPMTDVYMIGSSS